ncbi:RNA polymerase sigma factor [Crossiella sp. NPDC003009]
MDSDETLLTAVAAGDDSALRVLYERHATGLLRLLRRLTADARLAEDLLQETWLAVWQSAGGFRGESSARGWLFGVARRQAHNRLRRREAESVPLEDAPDPPDPSGDVEAAVLAEAGRREVMAAIDSLSAPLAEVVQLALVEELGYQDISAVLGVPVGTVKSRMSAARGQLSEILTRKAVRR